MSEYSRLWTLHRCSRLSDCKILILAPQNGHLLNLEPQTPKIRFLSIHQSCDDNDIELVLILVCDEQLLAWLDDERGVHE